VVETAASAVVPEVERLRVMMDLPMEQEALEEVVVRLVTGSLLVEEVLAAFSRLASVTLMLLLSQQAVVVVERMAMVAMEGQVLAKMGKPLEPAVSVVTVEPRVPVE
jgi:hypothetical protein